MIKELFDLWRKQSDLMKLQSAYALIILVTLVAAGLVGLLNQIVAWQILSLTWIATVAFFVNLVSFALVNLFVPPARARSTRPSQSRKRS
jgi:hypothetical protein